MKITVALLNKKNNFLNQVFQKLYILVFLGTLVLLSSLFIKYIYITPKVLNFATNLRQADTKISFFDVIENTYPLFNSKNYIFTDNSKNNENNDKNENDKNQDNINKTEYAKLDEMVSDENLKSVQAMAKNEQKNLNVVTSGSYQKISIYNVSVLNYSDNRSIDVESMFNKVITLTKESDSILLYNTHTSESYANSDKYKFSYDGTYRSRNASFNMLAITEELKSNLLQKDFKVVHDTTPHDYGTYESAYSKSRITVKKDLTQIGNVGISIDVHRDAAADLTYAPTVDINGVKIAQCMIVLGIGTDTLSNPYWQDNMALALQLQKIGNDYYPGLFKSMLVRNSVYNQDLNKFSILIEIGATGNTIDQALLSTRCLTNVLNLLYKN